MQKSEKKLAKSMIDEELIQILAKKKRTPLEKKTVYESIICMDGIMQFFQRLGIEDETAHKEVLFYTRFFIN